MNVVTATKPEELVPVPGGREIPVPEGVDPALFLRRQGRLWCATVKDAFDIAPRMRRVRVTGGDLIGFTHKPGQEIILRLPQPNGEVLRRHYTISSFDATASTKKKRSPFCIKRKEYEVTSELAKNAPSPKSAAIA